MQGLPSQHSMKALFVKAFLAELQLGDVEKAALFARAFLTQENPPVKIIPDEPLIPLLAN